MNKNIDTKKLLEIVSQKATAPDCIDFILNTAINRGASDIHLDPSPGGISVTFRIDGVLEIYGVLPYSYHGEVISRLKVLSHLRTDIHHLPHDGRFIFLSKDNPVDARISIMPTYYGENAVIRLLVRRHNNTSLEDLGFSDADVLEIKKISSRSSGLILVSGPTGSGKTSTLYSIMSGIRDTGRKVITLEDPIEYSVDGIRQIQINPHTGFTFAKGLRSILRQDPDVIMVGEIRDKETAAIAIHTALTGHLVLSTIHTSGAVEIIERLREMGVEEYLLASTLSLVISQRLVRVICSKCFNVEDHKSSCVQCRGFGYLGRTVIKELSAIGLRTMELIVRGLPKDDLRRHLVELGMETMVSCGERLVNSNKTTRQELMRAMGDYEENS